MNFSYNWLQSFFKNKKKLPKPKELAEFLTMKAFEVSEARKLGKDFVLNIDVLPNRASDCFSYLGMARECAGLINSKFQIPIFKIKENKKIKTKNLISIEVKEKMNCLRYTARAIVDVKVSSSPKWIQERLKIGGLRPINNIVDVVNYVMLETGQPLHAFDYDKISGFKTQNPKSKIKTQNLKKIIVRLAKNNEKIVTLDEEQYSLDNDILVIADINEPLAIAGIKGGKKAEITGLTKNIVLESANFNPQGIWQASRKLKLKTDASLRFEQGIDPNLTEFAINRAVYLIQKLAGGKITQGIIDFYPQKNLPKIIKLDLNYVQKLLGVKIKEKEIKNILQRLGFKILKRNNLDRSKVEKFIIVKVPTFRLDVSIEEDLIEEIGRVYGYQKIPAIFPFASLIPPKRNLDIFWENMTKDILKELGFIEVYNYSFISDKDAKIFGNHNLIEVTNPPSVDFHYLRASLIPNLLKNIKINQKNFKEIRIFELGKIFKKPKIKNQKLKTEEKRMLTGLISGDAFYQAKGVIDLLLNKLGISNIWYNEYKPTPEESKISIWQPNKCAEIKADNEEIGFLGEISSKTLNDLKIEKKVIIFDIDFEKLIKLVSEEQEYHPISKYPAAIRDLAVLVPLWVKVEEVLNKIEITGGKLLRDVDLFDIYEGEELPEGKKNLAFHLIFQADDHTLSSKEIDDLQNKIIKTLEEEPEWEVRR